MSEDLTHADDTINLRQYFESRILSVEKTALARISETERAILLLAKETRAHQEEVQALHIVAHDKEHAASERALELASKNLDLRLEKLNELRELVTELQRGYVPMEQYTQAMDRLYEKIVGLEQWKAASAALDGHVASNSEKISYLERNQIGRQLFDTTMEQWSSWRNRIDIDFQGLVGRPLFDKAMDVVDEKISTLRLADREALTRAEFDALSLRQYDEKAANKRSLNASLIFAFMATIGMIVNVILTISRTS